MDLNIFEKRVMLQIAIYLANITVEDIQKATEVNKEYFIQYIQNGTAETIMDK